MRRIVVAAAATMLVACASRKEATAKLPRAELFWSQPPTVIRQAFTTQLLAVIDAERMAWLAEERRAHGEVDPVISSEVFRHRLGMVHCHVDGSFDGGIPTQIASANQRVGVCPNWPVPRDSLHTRSSSADSGKQEVMRRPYPDSLITGLDSAVRAMPNDAWYLRQLVRVLTENGEYARAQHMLASCANDTWCSVLDGYVQYVQGNWSQASAEWGSALASMEAFQRCLLLTTVELIPFKRDTLEFATCSERQPLDQNVWWMTRPLLSDSLNYRLIEHVGRMVRIALMADLPRDAYYDLRPSAGGDAVGRMRLRYGWPEHSWWAGKKVDDGHLEYMLARGLSGAPYSSPEYARDVVTTTPSMSAAQSPLTAQDANFAVESEIRYSDARRWPQEFFRHPNGALLHIRTQQRALLHRDTTALLVMAVTLPSPLALDGADSTVRLQLLASPNPSSIRAVTATNARWGARAFISGELREPSVIGLEVNRGGSRIAGARMRFGVPTIPSHAASRTACALSEPILLNASVLTGPALEKLERGMLSDLALRRPEKLGLMWESYGVRAGDSVTLAVRVTGAQDRSGLARAVQSLGIVGQQEVAIAVSWREPSPARQVEVIPTRVPTLRRDLMLDVASLRTGTYGVQVTMKSRDCDTASPIRQFTVTR